jgi:hypothetical protein
MSNYVDPTYEPSTVHERQVLAAIRARGLNLHRLHADGRAVRVSGPGGIWILAAELKSVSLSDLVVTT